MPAMPTRNTFIYCFCDICKNRPEEAKFIKPSTHRSHKIYNKYDKMPYQQWLEINKNSINRRTPHFFNPTTELAEQPSNSVDPMQIDEVEEPVNASTEPEPVTATEPEPTTASTTESEPEPKPATPSEFDLLSDKLSQSPSSKILFQLVTDIFNNSTPRNQIEKYMQDLNSLLEIQNDAFRFPRTLAKFLKRSQLFKLSNDGIKFYNVCTSCHHLYEQKNEPGGEDIVCNQDLQNAVFKPKKSERYCKGKVYDYDYTREVARLVPQKEYPYCSIISTLKKFFLRQGFADRINEWRSREIVPGYMLDIYDGTGFAEFKALPNDPLPFAFLGDYNLLLTLNVDWFGPFSAHYSVGCIYLTIQNLPKANGRDFKKNMILVGVIPGPKEPPTTAFNHYLKPLVDELLVLLEGVEMAMVMKDGSVVKTNVRACLATICSDLPAIKKLASSMFFNSNFGCHLCHTQFPSIAGPGNQRNYCNWNCDTWRRRTREETRASSRAWKKAVTAKHRQELEQESGVRFSVLFKLPYFSYDLLAIEPMHVLYLGAAKTALIKMMPEDAYLKVQKIMQNHMDFNPQAPGNPMSKKIIKTGFPYVKAVEYKDFMTSMTHALLCPPTLDASIYMHMVELIHALRILDSGVIKMSDIDVVHTHLLNFAKQYEQAYGSESVPPNFHFMLHLRDCMH